MLNLDNFGIINHLRRIFVNTVNSLIYVFSKILPKDENIWLFGAWFGEKYADNSKYLFEYVNKNLPSVRAIWLTKDKNVYELLNKKGYEVYYTYSILGYYYASRASISFVSTSFDDVNNYLPAPIVFYLGHGIPLKKLVYDDRINYKKLNSKKKFSILKFFFPFIREPKDYDYLLASSEEDAKNLSSAFRIDKKNVPILGLPRNDTIKRANLSKLSNKTNLKVIYLPTHRKEGSENFFQIFLEDLGFINQRLKDLNVDLFIKFHYYHKSLEFENYSNIHFLETDDIYNIINDFDILITDYSSVYIDFLLSEKPIIFFPFDYEDYVKSDRELYYKYDDVTPGPKCIKWAEVIEWIEKFKANPYLYLKERKSIKRKFHKYEDLKSSERVVSYVIEECIKKAGKTFK